LRRRRSEQHAGRQHIVIDLDRLDGDIIALRKGDVDARLVGDDDAYLCHGVPDIVHVSHRGDVVGNARLHETPLGRSQV
jgi:hypothetical protein